MLQLIVLNTLFLILGGKLCTILFVPILLDNIFKEINKKLCRPSSLGAAYF